MPEKSAISDSFVQTQISKYLLYGIKIKYYLLSVSVLVFNHLHSFTEQTKKILNVSPNWGWWNYF